MHWPRASARPPPELLQFARELRTGSQPAELRLWHMLRAHRFGGLKFRRQHPVDPYVLDFYCPELRLAIELDGGQHADATARDQRRDAFLSRQGIRVLRFWNNELAERPEEVLEAIWLAAFGAGPAPSPGPLRGPTSPSRGR